MRLDPAIALAACGALCLLWSIGGLQKLIHRDYHRESVAGYELLPERLVPPFAILLSVLELCVGIGFAIPTLRSAAGFGSIALLGIYSAAIAINLIRGRRDIDCGCGGPALAQHLSEGLIARNLGLIAVSTLALLPVASRALGWVDGVTILGAVAFAAIFHTALNQILAQAPLLAFSRQ